MKSEQAHVKEATRDQHEQRDNWKIACKSE
jgi:hypothetical protein